MNKYKLAILASGNGSNAENIVNYFADNDNIEVALIISNKSNAFVLERAKKLQIESKVFDRKAFYDTSEVNDFLKVSQIDVIVLAGFLWLMPENIIKSYPKSIINIHPSLLPKYGGKGMYGSKVHEEVLKNKEKETGITIHLVDTEYDTGKVLFQAKTDISNSKSADQIAEKVHELEYLHFTKEIENHINRLESKS